MYTENMQERQEYNVVINHEEQYSIWPVGRKTPLGWQNVGKQRQKSACLDYIKDTWIDMRPLSVRQQLARQNRR